MWWIIIIIVVFLQLLLWLIVHSATRSIDDDTQAQLDDEQTKAVAEYLEKKKGKKQGREKQK